MSYNKVLYVSSGSYSYRRAKVGGFISSANGVIEGLLANHYDLDFITDSKLPGLLNGNIRYHYYDYRTLRKLLPIDFLKHIKTLPFVNKLFRVLLYIDAVLFKMSIDITLNRVLRKNRYDFIYMRSSASGSYVAKISKIYDIPLVLEVNKPQSMGPYNNRNSLAWPSSKKDVYVSDNERIQYEIASVITVDSTLRGKWITEFVDANMRDKIVVNPNAVNSDMFKPCDDVQDIKQLYHIDLARLIVGMASSFRWYNDKEEFFEIIRKTIFNNNRILFLLIVGDSTQYRLLKKMVHRYGFDNNVMLLEKVPFSKMPKVLNMCDILISHFNFHGVWPHNCSIKHLEYLAMGKPVVATNVGEVNFAIENNVNGVLITEGDVDNFSSAIIKLSHDGNMRKKYGANGRIKAEQKLTWENNVNKILSQLF